jgi:hypothetical protein
MKSQGHSEEHLPPDRVPTLLYSRIERKWRNWQTRRT